MRCGVTRSSRLAAGMLLTAWSPLLLQAQLASAADGSAATSGTVSPYIVAGSVVNGLTGAPVARALVRINARSVLTDGLGHFSFSQFTQSTGSVQVIRPGYAASSDDPGASGSVQSLDLTVPLELKIYPDAVLAGTVTGSDRLPVERAQVVLYRESWDEGGLHTIPVGFSQTDSHGEYRFREPPGTYRISIPFSARANQDGSVMLPSAWPEGGSAEMPAVFFASSNQERRIDLHARTAAPWPVRFRAEGLEGHANPRVTVHSASGDTFSIFAHSAGEDDVFEIQLPSGSYQLQAATQNHEGRQEAEAHVTVAGHAVDGLVLHFAAVPSIPVEMAVESSSSSGAGVQPPHLTNLGLRLQNINQNDFNTFEDAALTVLPADRVVLQASPGRYRLHAQFPSAWYIRSATYGGANLLIQPLTVVAGAGGEPVRIVVANDTGQLSGTVHGASPRSVSFVYLLAHQPTLLPVLQIQSDQDGSFSRVIPPGTYTAYAFPRRFPGDLRNPETLLHLAAGKEIDVPPSGKLSLDVTLQPVVLPR